MHAFIKKFHLGYRLLACQHCVTFANTNLLFSPILTPQYATRRSAPDISPISLGATTVGAAATSSATYTPCTPFPLTKMQTTIHKARGAALASTAGSTTVLGKSPAAVALIVRAVTPPPKPPRLPQHPQLTAEADLLSQASLSRRSRAHLKASGRACLVIGIGALSSYVLT